MRTSNDTRTFGQRPNIGTSTHGRQSTRDIIRKGRQSTQEQTGTGRADGIDTLRALEGPRTGSRAEAEVAKGVESR